MFSRRVAEDLSAFEPFDNLVEIGAGYGRDSILMSGRFPGCSVSALDLSSQAIALLKKRIEYLTAHGALLSNLEAVDWDIITSDSLFPGQLSHKQMMILAHSLIHLWGKQQTSTFLKDLAVRSEPGSRLFLSAFSREDSKFGQGTEIDEDTFCCIKRYPDLPIRFFSEAELSRVLKEAGWIIYHIESYQEREIIHDVSENSLYLYAHVFKGSP